MPAVDAVQPKRKVARRKRSTAPPRPVENQDRQRANANAPVPEAPAHKVRMYAHPGTNTAQNTYRTQRVAQAEQEQAQAHKRAARARLKRAVRKIHVTPVASPDATDSTRTGAQQAHDKAAVDKSVKTSRLKAVRKAGRGSGTRAAKAELEGHGKIAALLDKLGKRSVTHAGGTDSRLLATEAVHGPPSGAVGLAQRAYKDAINLPAQVVPSLYVPVAGAVEAAQGRPGRLEKLASDLNKSDPVLNVVAAGADAVAGREKQAGKRLKQAKKAASEHPGFAAAEVIGVEGAIGRGTGAALRHAPSKTARKIGSTERASRTLPGTGLREDRSYSPDVITKAGQVVKDKFQGGRAKLHRQEADRIEGENPDEAARLRQKAAEIDPNRHINEREIQKRVDEHVDAQETVRRHHRGDVVNEARGLVKQAGDAGPITRLVTEGIVRADVQDIKDYVKELKDEFPHLTNSGKRSNKALRRGLEVALTKTAKGKVDLEGLKGIAAKYRESQAAREHDLAAREMLPESQAAKAAAVPYATRRMGAEHTNAHRVAAADASKESLDHVRSRVKGLEDQKRELVGQQKVTRGRDAAKETQAVYEVNGTRFPTRAAAESLGHLAGGGPVKKISVTLAESKRVGEASRIDRALTAAKVELHKAEAAHSKARAVRNDAELMVPEHLYHGTSVGPETILKEGLKIGIKPGRERAVFAGSDTGTSLTYGDHLYAIDPKFLEQAKAHIKTDIGDPEGGKRIGIEVPPSALRYLGRKGKDTVPGMAAKAGKEFPGRPLSLDEIRRHMADHGEPIPSWLSQAPNARGAHNFFQSSTRAPGINGEARTGKATKGGTFDAHPETLVEGAAKQQGLIDAFDGFHDFLNEFGIKGSGGHIKTLHTRKQVEEAARNAMHDKNGDPIPGAVKFVPVRVNPFGGRAEQLGKLLEGTDDASMGGAQAINDAVHEALNGATGDGPWALVPEAAAKRLQEHVRVLNPGNAGKIGQKVNTVFRKTILATSVPWLLGNVSEGAGRALLAGAGPRSFVTGRRVIKRAQELDKVGGERAAGRLVGGGHFGSVERQQVHMNVDAMNPDKMKTVAKWFGSFWRAGENHPKVPSPAMAANLWHGFTHVAFNTVNRAIETQIQTAMLGKALHGSDLMDAPLRKASEAAVDKAAHGVLDQNTAAALGRQIDIMYGKYGKWSPDMRKAVALYTPFVAWTLNATYFVLRTMPRDHPVALGLIASMENATDEWRKEHGLDKFIKGAVPGWLQGSIPGPGGSHYRAPNRYTPWGLFGDPLGGYASAVLPVASGVIAAGKGKDWQGNDLKDQSDAGKAKAAGASILQETVPFLSLGGKIVSDGPGAVVDSAVGKVAPSKKRARRSSSSTKPGSFVGPGSGSGGKFVGPGSGGSGGRFVR